MVNVGKDTNPMDPMGHGIIVVFATLSLKLKRLDGVTKRNGWYQINDDGALFLSH